MAKATNEELQKELEEVVTKHNQAFEFMNKWKSSQEQEMLLRKGNSLQNKNLSNFLRMLNVSIPHKSFDDINSHALFLIDQERNLIEAGLNLRNL